MQLMYFRFRFIIFSVSQLQRSHDSFTEFTIVDFACCLVCVAMWRFKLHFGLMLVLGVCVCGADASALSMLCYTWV